MDRIYMEVDLEDKELPTGKFGRTAAELARACGVNEGTVRRCIYQARHNGYRSRYVVVVCD